MKERKPFVPEGKVHKAKTARQDGVFPFPGKPSHLHPKAKRTQKAPKPISETVRMHNKISAARAMRNKRSLAQP